MEAEEAEEVPLQTRVKAAAARQNGCQQSPARGMKRKATSPKKDDGQKKQRLAVKKAVLMFAKAPLKRKIPFHERNLVVKKHRMSAAEQVRKMI
jgi:hypothetical protein